MWYGQASHGKRKLTTKSYSTPEEAARAVDRCGSHSQGAGGTPIISAHRAQCSMGRVHVARRYLYKVKGPEACNFPVTPTLAAELDGLAVEQIQEQFKRRCGRGQRRAEGGG